MHEPPSHRDYDRSSSLNLDIVLPILLLIACGVAYMLSPDVLQAMYIAVVPLATAKFRERLIRFWRARYSGGVETLTLALVLTNIWAVHSLYRGLIASFEQRPIVSAIVLAMQAVALGLIVSLQRGWLLPDHSDIVRLSCGAGGPVVPNGYAQRPIRSFNERLVDGMNRQDEKE